MGQLELAGVHEVARRLGVTRQRVHQLADLPGFPEPVARLRAGSIWLVADIEEWRRTMRPFSAHTAGMSVPDRDPERPQDDPWDADAVRFLLATPDGARWKRGELMECLREQPGRVKRQPGRVAEAKELAAKYDVERTHDVGGSTMHFFRTDDEAPLPYPASDSERRAWLRKFG